MWCFLSVFYLSTLHSINMWSCLLSSVFAWGQARSKLGGSWYVHFASLFYIIIYCYSLIYFIFRDDTYVILPVLHVSSLLEDYSPESGFCWKKHRQDTIFLEFNNSRKIYRSSYFVRWRREPKRETKVGHRGPSPHGGAAPYAAAPPYGEEAQAHLNLRPFAFFII